MIMTVLKVIIALFIVMCAVGLIRGKGRSKATTQETAREVRKLESYGEKIKRYEEDPDGSGITEDEYILACYFAEKPYRGYDLKKAVAFHTTCEMRGIRSEEGMKNILSYDGVFGEASKEGIDVMEFNELGERISGLVADLKRIERA